MSYADKETIRMLVTPNWRGISIADMVCQFQADSDEIDNIKALGSDIIRERRPQECPEQEWIDLHLFALEARMKSVIDEIERRQHVRNPLPTTNNEPLVQTIKERLRVEDVLGWYTEVIVSHGKYEYRCTLHGQDKHPSGHIYLEEQRCWCFACNQGGDVIDVVHLFEKLDNKGAILKLADHLGLSTKPIAKRKGGFSIEVNRCN